MTNRLEFGGHWLHRRAQVSSSTVVMPVFNYVLARVARGCVFEIADSAHVHIMSRTGANPAIAVCRLPILAELIGED